LEDLNLKKLTSILLAFMLIFVTTITCFADVAQSEGWIPIHTSNGPNGSKVDVSPLHWGWASPEASNIQHINVVIYISGTTKANFHLYKLKNCYKAYESESRKYVENFNKKCYTNDKEAIVSLLESKGIYSMSDIFVNNIQPYIGSAAATVVVGFIIKALVAFFTANPFVFLIPA
jgi:hypothetical protein